MAVGVEVAVLRPGKMLTKRNTWTCWTIMHNMHMLLHDRWTLTGQYSKRLICYNASCGANLATKTSATSKATHSLKCNQPAQDLADLETSYIPTVAFDSNHTALRTGTMIPLELWRDTLPPHCHLLKASMRGCPVWVHPAKGATEGCKIARHNCQE
jgi:hypothetical protein